MKSITIHSLDDSVYNRIQTIAKEKGQSLNKTIKTLLEKKLGLTPTKPTDHKEEFKDLFGVWNKNDMTEFQNTTKDFEKIDPNDWT